MPASTTIAAYKALPASRVGTIRAQILEILEAAGAHGCIMREIQDQFPESTPDGSLGGRINELENDAEIFRNGDTRVARGTGCEQLVIRLARYSASPVLPTAPKKRISAFLRGVAFAAAIVKDNTPGFKGSPASVALKVEMEKIIRRAV